MKLLTFLGIADYKETTYVLRDQKYTTRYCPAAITYFCRPETTLIVVTDLARETHFEALADEISNFSIPIDLPIPDGHSETDLWKIFDALTAQVNQGDELVVDITNGFRSLPFLSFLAVAFLRLARNVEVRCVYYGAFEARDKELNESPVFDLTPFVTLLDWTIATNQFATTGNASALAVALNKINNPALEPLSKSVEQIATGLHLLRPKEVSEAAATLSQNLTPVRQDLPPPFALLSDNLTTSYSRFGQSGLADARATLICQLEMINWYHSRGQIVHALSLAREWVVSLLSYHFNLDAEDKANREEMEFLLNGGKDKAANRESKYLAQWQTEMPRRRRKQLHRLWQSPFQLANLRNDVLHSGFRRNPKSSEDVMEAANDVLSELKKIAVEWGLHSEHLYTNQSQEAKESK